LPTLNDPKHATLQIFAWQTRTTRRYYNQQGANLVHEAWQPCMEPHGDKLIKPFSLQIKTSLEARKTYVPYGLVD